MATPTTVPAARQLAPSLKPRFFSAARPQRVWVVCQTQQHEDKAGPQQHHKQPISRRKTLLGAATLMTAPLLLPSSAALAENDAITRGLGVYIKKKKYDAIDTYLPPLVAARGQLIRSGYLMAQDPNAARLMLREGAFSGLRDNVRAIGEYAAQQGRAEEGAALVNGFFKALEGYDFLLLQGSRSKEAFPLEEGQAKLNAAVEALDKLLAAVPEEMSSRARTIVSELEAELESAREAAAAQADENLRRQEEELKKLL